MPHSLLPSRLLCAFPTINMSQPLSHVVRVQRLYRNSLRNTLNWTIDRALYRSEAAKLRGRFEENRTLSMPADVERAVSEGEAELKKKQHPDPWIPCWAPGGSKYQRNLEAPKELIYPELWDQKYGSFHSGNSH